MINIIKCKRLEVCSTLISIPRKSHKVFVYDDASRLSLAVSTGILNEKQFCQQENSRDQKQQSLLLRSYHNEGEYII